MYVCMSVCLSVCLSVCVYINIIPHRDVAGSPACVYNVCGCKVSIGPRRSIIAPPKNILSSEPIPLARHTFSKEPALVTLHRKYAGH